MQFPFSRLSDSFPSITRVACISSIPSSHSLDLLRAIATGVNNEVNAGDHHAMNDDSVHCHHATDNDSVHCHHATDNDSVHCHHATDNESRYNPILADNPSRYNHITTDNDPPHTPQDSSDDSVIISDSSSDPEPPRDSTRRSVVTTTELYESRCNSSHSSLAPRKALRRVVQSSTICEKVYMSRRFSPESRSRIYENESRLAQLLNGQEMNDGLIVENP